MNFSSTFKCLHQSSYSVKSFIIGITKIAYQIIIRKIIFVCDKLKDNREAVVWLLWSHLNCKLLKSRLQPNYSGYSEDSKAERDAVTKDLLKIAADKANGSY